MLHCNLEEVELKTRLLSILNSSRVWIETPLKVFMLLSHSFYTWCKVHHDKNIFKYLVQDTTSQQLKFIIGVNIKVKVFEKLLLRNAKV